jgi:hypothetical protein
MFSTDRICNPPPPPSQCQPWFSQAGNLKSSKSSNPTCCYVPDPENTPHPKSSSHICMRLLTVPSSGLATFHEPAAICGLFFSAHVMFREESSQSCLEETAHNSKFSRTGYPTYLVSLDESSLWHVQRRWKFGSSCFWRGRSHFQTQSCLLHKSAFFRLFLCEFWHVQRKKFGS